MLKFMEWLPELLRPPDLCNSVCIALHFPRACTHPLLRYVAGGATTAGVDQARRRVHASARLPEKWRARRPCPGGPRRSATGAGHWQASRTAPPVVHRKRGRR